MLEPNLNMNEQPKSIWRKPWSGWRGFFLAFGAITVAEFVIFACIGSLSSPGGVMFVLTPSGSGKFLLTDALRGALGLAFVVTTGIVFVRWLLCWRNFRRFLIGVVSVATLITLFYTVENWRGDRAWEKHKREMEAKGEKMEWADFIPAPVPDEQNFAMTPLLKPLFDFKDNPKNYEDRWRDTNGYNHICQLHLQRDDLPSSPELGNWAKGLRTDLKAYQSYYRTNGNSVNRSHGIEITVTNKFPVASEPQTPAADVLLALSRFDSELKELQEASRRPYSRFPIHYNTEDCWSILLPHLIAMKSMGAIAALRATAELQAGKTGEACQDVLLSLRLGESVKAEPFIISQLVRFAVLSMAIDPIWEGISDHRWSDDDLQQFQRELEKIDALAEYLRSIRTERAADGLAMKYLSRRRKLDWMSGLGETSTNQFKEELFLHLAPRGWFYQNAIFISSFIQEKALPLVNPVEQRIYPSLSRSSIAYLKSLPLSTANFWAKDLGVFFPGSKYARAQNAANLASTACALERFRLAHGNYPEKLDQLATAFLAKLPHDLINGQALKYRVEANGQFVLYSVGWDEKDDGGSYPVITEASGWKQAFNDMGDSGDWVWRFPAK
jgi:hypothetical protein